MSTGGSNSSAALATSQKKDGEAQEPLSFGEIMRKASASAVRGGTAGAVAMGANVLALMWMRTTVRLLGRVKSRPRPPSLPQ